MTDVERSSAADRMRRLRARRQRGLRVVSVAVSVDAVQALLEAGLVDRADDEQQLSEAVSELIEDQVVVFARENAE